MRKNQTLGQAALGGLPCTFCPMKHWELGGKPLQNKIFEIHRGYINVYVSND